MESREAIRNWHKTPALASSTCVICDSKNAPFEIGGDASETSLSCTQIDFGLSENAVSIIAVVLPGYKSSQPSARSLQHCWRPVS